MGLPRKLIGGAVAATAALAAASVSARRSEPPERPPPAAGFGRHAWRQADLFYARSGVGPAALLVHDLYAGASGEEMGPLVERVSSELDCFSLDLPGFGRSGRPRLRYGPDLFVDAIVEFVRHEIDAPTLLVGSGLSAAYVTEAALRLGRLATGAVLLAPPEPLGTPIIESSPWRPFAYQLLRSPLGDAYHLWRASGRHRRRILERDLAVEPLDIEARADRLHRYASQRDARWPLWSLWAGDLTWDPRAALSRLGVPALVIWGAEARENAAAPEAYHAVRPDLTQEVVPGTARWPHVDAPDALAGMLLEWWAREGAAHERAPSESGEE
jgi:pimeloyl-ACP methyl ester carboxylesterase